MNTSLIFKIASTSETLRSNSKKKSTVFLCCNLFKIKLKRTNRILTMLTVILVTGIVCLIVGIIVWLIGRRVE